MLSRAAKRIFGPQGKRKLAKKKRLLHALMFNPMNNKDSHYMIDFLYWKSVK
jgi:hypothetical protein